MIWHAFARWVLAGCFSMAALSVTMDSQGNFPRAEKTPSEAAPADDLPQAFEPSTQDQASSNLSIRGTPSDSSAPSLLPSAPSGDAGIKGQAAPAPFEEYKIQREDVLNITVYEEPDLTTKVRVTGSGEIHFPLLGRVTAAGLSVIEVQEKLTKLLAEDYLVNPQVQIFIETYHERSVFVTGSVNKPGSYPLPSGKSTTLMEAIAMAGGFHEKAAVNGTRIIRIEDGKEKTIYVKAKDIIKKGDKSKDVEVRPNDVIFVPESFF